jgi:hypothetical protein
MKLGVVHLSDIHLKLPPATNSILGHASSLRAAIRQRILGQDACLIIMSGDTAYAGLADEYKLAVPFFKELLIGLLADIAPIPIHFAIVSGNHDCDFKKETDVRRIILKTAASTQFTDSSAIEQCLTVQEPYRAFVHTLQTECNRVPCTALVSWYDFSSLTLAGKRISLQLFNSAWTSQVRESAGTLTFPTHLLPPASTPLIAPDLVISVIHHPLNWFDATHRRELARYLEDTSDLILTGHEHISGFTSKQTHPGPNNEYLEGGVLQETSRPDDSTFTITHIDLDTFTQTTETFTWNPKEGMYRSPSEPTLVRTFQRNQLRLRSTLPFSVTFDTWLHDPGVHLSHPTKQQLLLDDIFVQHDFREVSTSETQDPSALVPGEKFLETILANKHVIVFGGEISGKTTLAKKLIQQLKARGIVPLYFGAESHVRLKNHTTEQVLAEAAVKQYGQSQLDRYQQLPHTERALIIDDYQLLPFDAAQRQAFLTHIAQAHEIVILLATDDVRLEEFARSTLDILSLWEFKHLELLEFGFVKRSELCRKWYGSAAHSHADVAKAQATFAKVEAQLSAVIGEQVFPAYPLFLLMILQQLEIGKKDTVVSGSVGYLYEAMVIRDLESATTRYADIDTNKNYLAEFAYRLFCDGTQQLSLTEFASWHQQYCRRYKLSLDCDTQQESLSNAGLLSVAHGMIGFHYPYHFYYFVADYLQGHLSDERVRNQIRTLTTFFHQGQAANIILFLCYRSRDTFILDSVCETAACLFETHLCCELGEDVKNLPFAVGTTDIRFEEKDLGDSNPEANRQMLLQESDHNALAQPECEAASFGMTPETACDLRKLNEQMQLSAALKTIQIIGQILKNHVGSLEGDVKTKLVGTSTALGLRAMHSVVNALKDSLEGMVQVAVQTYERKHGALPMFKQKKLRSKEQIAETVNRSLWAIAQMGVVAIVKYISESLGSERLAQTYTEVFAGEQPPSVALVDLAIRLDHFSGFPEKEALAIIKRLSQNPFGFSVVRDLIWMRFYLYHSDYRMRQRILGKLNLTNEAKKRVLDQRPKRGPISDQRRFPK